MKISVVKMVLLVPFLLFLDWVIMAITGSLSSLLGADDQFYCTIYCYFGIIVLITTFLIIAYILVRPYLHPHRRVHV
jgi:hypothetical protein